MYVNKYDKNNIQTKGNEDKILVSQIRSTIKAIVIKTITYFHSGPLDFFTLCHNTKCKSIMKKQNDN